MWAHSGGGRIREGSLGVWAFRPSFVRLLARQHCMGHGVLLRRWREAMTERLGRYQIDRPEKQDGEHVRDGHITV